ncbi:transcription factor [Phaffia rhodozyma]|uniref:Transcription factor n=1 Tax=Phaffia rhodozyma TaxID=264483 RepID=A0A0F7SG20_PHARH|nr:transcription factor [Phaffia rhodozyma]
MPPDPSKPASTYRERVFWTPEEDALLLKLVAIHGSQRGKDSKWPIVAAALEGRNIKDCRKRYFHSLAPNLKKGRWSKEEDRLLLEGLEKLGPVWYKIAQMIPGRKDDQCAKRWKEVLDPSLSKGQPWSKEEDESLLSLFETTGPKWQLIAKSLPGRTGLCCRNRWRKFKGDEKVAANLLEVEEQQKKTGGNAGGTRSFPEGGRGRRSVSFTDRDPASRNASKGSVTKDPKDEHGNNGRDSMLGLMTSHQDGSPSRDSMSSSQFSELRPSSSRLGSENQPSPFEGLLDLQFPPSAGPSGSNSSFPHMFDPLPPHLKPSDRTHPSDSSARSNGVLAFNMSIFDNPSQSSSSTSTQHQQPPHHHHQVDLPSFNSLGQQQSSYNRAETPSSILSNSSNRTRTPTASDGLLFSRDLGARLNAIDEDFPRERFNVNDSGNDHRSDMSPDARLGTNRHSNGTSNRTNSGGGGGGGPNCLSNIQHGSSPGGTGISPSTTNNSAGGGGQGGGGIDNNGAPPSGPGSDAFSTPAWDALNSQNGNTKLPPMASTPSSGHTNSTTTTSQSAAPHFQETLDADCNPTWVQSFLASLHHPSASLPPSALNSPVFTGAWEGGLFSAPPSPQKHLYLHLPALAEEDTEMLPPSVMDGSMPPPSSTARLNKNQSTSSNQQRQQQGQQSGFNGSNQQNSFSTLSYNNNNSSSSSSSNNNTSSNSLNLSSSPYPPPRSTYPNPSLSDNNNNKQFQSAPPSIPVAQQQPVLQSSSYPQASSQPPPQQYAVPPLPYLTWDPRPAEEQLIPSPMVLVPASVLAGLIERASMVDADGRPTGRRR